MSFVPGGQPPSSPTRSRQLWPCLCGASAVVHTSVFCPQVLCSDPFPCNSTHLKPQVEVDQTLIESGWVEGWLETRRPPVQRLHLIPTYRKVRGALGYAWIANGFLTMQMPMTLPVMLPSPRREW